MKEITQYFRNAVLASTQRKIDYKSMQFETITTQEVETGTIKCETLAKIWQGIENKENDKEEKYKDVIIALKTIATEFLEAGHIENDIEEMTSILFLPAKLDIKGKMYSPGDKYPWIPRGFLKPMIEPQIAIGTTEEYDEFWEETTDQRNQINSWQKYLQYAKDMYNKVTGANYEDNYIGEKQIKTDVKFYIFEDDTVKATAQIEKLYNELLKNDETLLYSRMTNGRTEPSRELISKLNYNKMKEHVGQMGGEYPLSPSQREAIHCFQNLEDGEVLAVNGPPGTGKTTFLQSVVANMYVEAALKEEEPPLIIATSTNNQAVTNIIESFAKINPIGIRNLEQRWITGVNSFSVYFPSDRKIKEAEREHYQYTKVTGGGFAEEVETKENRKSSQALFYNEFGEYFNEKKHSLQLCKQRIHSELKKVDFLRIACIEKLEHVKSIIGNGSCLEYISDLEERLEKVGNNLHELKELKEQIKQNGDKLRKRKKEWRSAYDSLPWYIRLLKFLPCFKRKIIAWAVDFMEYEELEFLDRSMNINEIEEKYYQCIGVNDANYRQMIDKENEVIEKQKGIQKEYDIYAALLGEIKTILLEYSTYKVKISTDDFLHEFDIEKVNNTLDKLRYAEFWLSVHYYEALWLQEDYPLTEKQKGKTYENVLDKTYHRLAMLAPCMVMTCYKLPQLFYAYRDNDEKHYYMYNYADLLIVDEAGQISPEIGMAAFALAKKAVVVGDEYQIPPVWGNERALDMAMAIENNVIKNKEEFSKLEDNGLNCSQSSVMKVASLSCPFEKYGKGLFLSEHRRCYNEIVQYCNELVYNGNLEPLRGYAEEDANNVLSGYLPPMGYKQIETEYSQRAGGSRKNEEEAKAIVEWLGENYLSIVDRYKKREKKDEFNEKNIIGIITPFNQQSIMIKQYMRKYLPQFAGNISVGTVHTFQGAERKVIIFSTVYGNQEECYFINANKSLLNVAVSRAKDSFLIFGDRGCLTGGSTSAAGLLKKAVNQEI